MRWKMAEGVGLGRVRSHDLLGSPCEGITNKYVLATVDIYMKRAEARVYKLDGTGYVGKHPFVAEFEDEQEAINWAEMTARMKGYI